MSLGMVGKWAIHPSQIAPALEIFSPAQSEVDRARRYAKAFREAEGNGLGAVQIDGTMIDIASIRMLDNTLKRAELLGM